MASVVSGVATTINLICDLCMIGESIQAWINAKEAGENSLIETASLVNGLALTGFSITGIGMIVSGKKSESLSKLKNIELAPRFLNMPIQLYLETKKMAPRELEKPADLRCFIRLFEKGIIAPTSDVLRTAVSADAYDEQHFLDISPEELKEAKRPIYKEVFDGETITQEIVGYKPVDPDECRENLENLRSNFKIATKIRELAQAETAEGIICGLTVPTYERLEAFINAHQPPPEHEEQDLHINFLDFENIPEPLINDQVFRSSICPITRRPIRDPVRDPTHRITLYERRAIVNWLQVNPISPMTRQPLQVGQLLEAPMQRTLINHRLQEYQDGFQHLIQQHAKGQPVV